MWEYEQLRLGASVSTVQMSAAEIELRAEVAKMRAELNSINKDHNLNPAMDQVTGLRRIPALEITEGNAHRVASAQALTNAAATMGQEPQAAPTMPLTIDLEEPDNQLGLTQSADGTYVEPTQVVDGNVGQAATEVWGGQAMEEGKKAGQPNDRPAAAYAVHAEAEETQPGDIEAPMGPVAAVPAAPVESPAAMPAAPVEPAAVSAAPVEPPTAIHAAPVEPPAAVPAVEPPAAVPAAPLEPPAAVHAAPVEPPAAMPAAPVEPPTAIYAAAVEPPVAVPATPVERPVAVPATPVEPPVAVPAAPVERPTAVHAACVEPPAMPAAPVEPPARPAAPAGHLLQPEVFETSAAPAAPAVVPLYFTAPAVELPARQPAASMGPPATAAAAAKQTAQTVEPAGQTADSEYMGMLQRRIWDMEEKLKLMEGSSGSRDAPGSSSRDLDDGVDGLPLDPTDLPADMKELIDKTSGPIEDDEQALAKINFSTHRNAGMRLNRFMGSKDGANYPHMMKMFEAGGEVARL